MAVKTLLRPNAMNWPTFSLVLTLALLFSIANCHFSPATRFTELGRHNWPKAADADADHI
jgi:hypothetical protein